MGRRLALTPFRRFRSGDRALDEAQANVDAALRPVLESPLLGGLLVGPLTFASGSTQLVAHGLGRAPRGWLLVSPRGHAALSESDSPSGRHLALTSDADLTCSLWVF